MAAGGWDDGYVSEYCAQLESWSRAIVSPLRRGAAFWFDYGLPRPQYYIPERHEGTLLCHFRHHAFDDPFRHPGLQDITAWVDFTALADACAAADCELAGFTTQAFFLAGLGIDGEMRALAAGDADEFARLANQARRLMLPGEMGERFQSHGVDSRCETRNYRVSLCKTCGTRCSRHGLSIERPEISSSYAPIPPHWPPQEVRLQSDQREARSRSAASALSLRSWMSCAICTPLRPLTSLAVGLTAAAASRAAST